LRVTPLYLTSPPTRRSSDLVQLFVSVITIHELELGALQAERKDARAGAILREWLERHVLPAFADRIVPVDTDVAVRAAGLLVPDPRPLQDTLIAATALVHGMTVATRNVADFVGTGAKLVNPWAD